jgi:hypothetical protein
MKMHNFCIQMQQSDGGGGIGQVPEGGIDPSDFDIAPFEGNPFGFLKTGGIDVEDCVGQFNIKLDMGQDSSMRSLGAPFGMSLWNHNCQCNLEWDYDDDSVHSKEVDS